MIKKFEDYFDQNFKNKISQLEKLKQNYVSTLSLLQEIRNVLNEYNDKNLVSNLYDSVKTFIDKNIEQIDLKLKNLILEKKFNLYLILKRQFLILKN